MLSADMKLHLCLFNNPFIGVSDQVDFIKETVAEAGCHLSVGRFLRPDSINILIENFSPAARDMVIEFCQHHQTRVFVVMTEHIDFQLGQIFFHGQIWKDSDYMPVEVQRKRLVSLLEMTPWIAGFLTLGDLPELIGFDTMVSGASPLRLPFPRILRAETGQGEQAPYDFIFTGVLTEYRRQVLAQLSEHFRVYASSNKLSRAARRRLYHKGRIILNIPQSEEWGWISPMRVMAAARCGRPCVSIGRMDPSVLGRINAYIDLADRNAIQNLTALLGEHRSFFARYMASYAETTSAYNACSTRGVFDKIAMWRPLLGL